MQNELKEKLQNLSEKFNTDLDVISLKALCSVPENEDILFAISEKLNNLLAKYPEDKEIFNLLPKKEVNYEELLSYLKEKYPEDSEVVTLEAILLLDINQKRDLALKDVLENLLAKYLEDEKIITSLGKKKPFYDENMVFVEGGVIEGKYGREDIEIFDLYVDKYITTQEEWEEILGKIKKDKFGLPIFSTHNSKIKGKRKPVVEINRADIYEYCNRLSEKHGFEPVYKIKKVKNDNMISRINPDGEVTEIKIKQLDGKEVPPNLADFSKTEGYRLPTSMEWEWFARGGKPAQEKGTFTKEECYKYSLDDKGWFYNSSWSGPQDVGLKEPNELGIYDYIGNVNQLVYDTEYGGYCSEQYGIITEEFPYVFDEQELVNYISRGGYFELKLNDYSPFSLFTYSSDFGSRFDGFRIVRTARPRRK